MESNLPFLNDGKFHDINLGRTFLKRDTAFHTLRYDFKPASVDVDQPGQVEVGEGNEVSIILPHTEGSKNPSTTYRGSKKPALKECILIYDEETGSFTLERITSQIQVKKTRLAGNIKLPPLPPLKPPSDTKPSKSKKTINSPTVDTQKFELPTMQETERLDYNQQSTTQESDYRDILTTSMSEIKKSSELSSSGEDSSSSGSSSSDNSSDDSDVEMPTTQVVNPPPQQHNALQDQLADDLMLSESSSSDSD